MQISLGKFNQLLEKPDIVGKKIVEKSALELESFSKV